MLSNFLKVLMAHISFTAVLNNGGIGKGIGGIRKGTKKNYCIKWVNHVDYAIFTTTFIIIITLSLLPCFISLQFFFYIFIRRLVVCRTSVLYEPTNGLPWDRAVFSSVIELRVTHSKSLWFFKSQETNEIKYLSRLLKSMEDWIYGSLPGPKFTDTAKQLSVSSGKWSTTLSPTRAFDFVSNARLWKNKKI